MLTSFPTTSIEKAAADLRILHAPPIGEAEVIKYIEQRVLGLWHRTQRYSAISLRVSYRPVVGHSFTCSVVCDTLDRGQITSTKSSIQDAIEEVAREFDPECILERVAHLRAQADELEKEAHLIAEKIS